MAREKKQLDRDEMRSNRNRLFEILGTLGALASIAALWIWVVDSDTREESAALRRLTLIEAAQTILDEEASDGLFENSKDVNWAFRVFARYGETANIRAKKVDLLFTDLRCVSAKFEAEQILVEQSVFLDTIFDVDDTNLEISDSIVMGLSITVTGSVEDASSYHISNSIVYSLNVFSMTREWPRLTLENILLNHIGVSSIPKSLVADGRSILSSVLFDENACGVTARNERSGIVYLECEFEQISDETQDKFISGWMEDQLVIELFGEIDLKECKDRERIDFTRTPFRALQD